LVLLQPVPLGPVKLQRLDQRDLVPDATPNGCEAPRPSANGEQSKRDPTSTWRQM
jgi:hypothetical protein